MAQIDYLDGEDWKPEPIRFQEPIPDLARPAGGQPSRGPQGWQPFTPPQGGGSRAGAPDPHALETISRLSKRYAWDAPSLPGSVPTQAVTAWPPSDLSRSPFDLQLHSQTDTPGSDMPGGTPSVPPSSPSSPPAPPAPPQAGPSPGGGMGSRGWHNSSQGQHIINFFREQFAHIHKRQPTAGEMWTHLLSSDRLPSWQYTQAILTNIRNSVARSAAPSAPSRRPEGQSFRAWWDAQVAGKPVTQQTLLDLEEALKAQGSKLTPANSIGERTKIWDPDLKDWVRVGFGEGNWVYIPQGWGEHGPTAAAAAAPAGGSRWSDEATKAMEAYIKERIERLKQPAYTGAEWETFRTAALDPIEGDRQASRQRALQNIGARGLDPTSGIAQELLNQVDAGFDQSRAKTQNQLAYNRVNEQRSREQEAQALLTILHELPNQSLQQALAALGMGPNPQSLSNQYMQYWQGQQANSLPWWQMLGSLLPHLFPGSR